MNCCTIILHYGSPELTAGLFALLRTANPAQPIRVFDNAAPLAFPHAWHRAESNLYWAGALETCMNLVEHEGFTHLWFLNNDVHFPDPPHLPAILGRLARLDRRLEHPVGLWSPAVAVNPYHPQMRPSGQAGCLRRVHLLDGPAPLLRLEAVRKAGGLDAADNPYGYGVDMWLSWRVAAQGWPVLVDQDMVMRHRAHSTAKTVEGFFDCAAQAEDAFCRARFGPEWRKRLEAQKQADAAPENLIYPYGD